MWTARCGSRPPLEHVQTPKILRCPLLKAAAPIYAKLVRRVRTNSSCSIYPRHRRFSSDHVCIFFFAPTSLSFSLSFFLHSTIIWICAPLVISDSHRHLEIHELRPRVSDCIIALRWNILWKLRGRKSSVKAPRLFSCVKIPLGVSPRLEPKLRLLSVLLVHHNPEIDRAHYCTPNLSTPRSSNFFFFFFSTLKSLLYVSCLRHTLSPRLFLTFTHTLPFSHWFHLHTCNFFFLAPFQKDIF